MVKNDQDWETVERWASSPTLTDTQRSQVGDFLNDERALQSQSRTVFNHVYYAVKLGEATKKPYDELKLDDVKAHLAKLSSQQSKTPKIGLLKLFKWLLLPLEDRKQSADEGAGKPLDQQERERLFELKKCVATIRKSISSHAGYKQKLPDELLSQEDVLKLLKAAGTTRDKAIVAFLYDTGCRASELCNIQIKHVAWDQMHWAETEQGSKVEFVPVFLRSRRKGERQVYLSKAVPFVKTWLNEHQRRDEPEEYLFYSRKTMGRLQGPNMVGQIIGRAARASGIKKRVHPHLFRHSRATEMAQHLTEQELKLWFGWTGGSRMPATYVHLSPAKLMTSLNRMMGIKEQMQVKPGDALSERICMKCSSKSLPGARFCDACGYPLSASMAVDFEKAATLANRAMVLRLEELERRLITKEGH